MSLPKTYRLRRRQDFQQVYQKGRRRTGTHLSVTVLARPRSLDEPAALLNTCFGISIGKKVSKKAVVRNLIKRRIKGALRQSIGQILPGKMVVIICKPSIVGCDYDEILRELEKLLLTLEVMHGHQGNNLL
jgi:ribonuclease P protein component